MIKTDLLVIGAGPGGYVAAFLAADLGLQVTLVNLDPAPGGVCLYQGCIPSKALLHIANLIDETKSAEHLGVIFGEPRIELEVIRKWKNNIITKLSDGLNHLCKIRNIRYIQGKASFTSSRSAIVDKVGGDQLEIAFEKAIIATGSKPVSLAHLLHSQRMLEYTNALNLEALPESLLVVGGGYIGLELGTVYAQLGSRVSIVEKLPELLTGVDRDLVSILERRLKNMFHAIMLNTQISSIDEISSGIIVNFQGDHKKVFSEHFEKILIAVGRKPDTGDLNLKTTQVTLNERGFIKVNASFQTDDPGIYAVGDIVGEPLLAHKASFEAHVAVHAIVGKNVDEREHVIPAVIYTNPEIAFCGLTETQAKKDNREIHVVKLPWNISGRALTMNRSDGLTKIIFDPKSEKILGMSIAGVNAGELIAEGVLAINMSSTARDLHMSIHPHPSLSETLMEAAAIFYGSSPHIYRTK